MSLRNAFPTFIAAGVAMIGGIIAIVSVLVVFPPAIFGDANITIGSLWGLFIGGGLLVGGLLVEIALAVVLLFQIRRARTQGSLAEV
jgi:hypothetical protein